MKNNIIIMFLLFFLILSGCAKRIEIVSVEKERLDQDLSQGNKGYIQGTKPPIEEQPRATSRQIYQVTVALPPYPEWDKYKTEDKELWGNRGYVYGGPQTIPPSQEKSETQRPIVLPEEDSRPVTKKVGFETKKIPEEQSGYTIYVVKKGDTLGKIARSVLGKASKWKIIYEANREAIKNPDKIYPGQKLRIPQN